MLAKQVVRGNTPFMLRSARPPTMVGITTLGVPAGGVARYTAAVVRYWRTAAAVRGVNRLTSKRSIRATRRWRDPNLRSAVWMMDGRVRRAASDVWWRSVGHVATGELFSCLRAKTFCTIVHGDTPCARATKSSFGSRPVTHTFTAAMISSSKTIERPKTTKNKYTPLGLRPKPYLAQISSDSVQVLINRTQV
eukprot:7334499-Prymnesium_polylepis.1